jgi:tetratricopeptide (TPR) repeat protein
MPVGKRLALGLALALVCGSARSAETSWRERLDRAEKLSDEGALAESTAAAEGVLADADKSLRPGAPEIVEVLSGLEEVYEAAGADARLIEIRERLSAASKNFTAWFALGRILRREERPREAEAALKRALALKPASRGAADELAEVYEDMGRFEEAAALMKSTMTAKQRGELFYARLARLEARLGRYAEAREDFARARKSGAESAGTYIAEGYFYMQSGHSAQAEDAFESAIAVDTAGAEGYHHMGTYLYTAGRYAEAERYIRRALEIEDADPGVVERDRVHTMQWLGDDLQAQGRRDEAKAVYLEMLKKAAPGDLFQLTALRSLGKLYVSEGKSDLAESAYKRAVDACAPPARCEFASAGGASIDLGLFYLGQGRRADAEAAAERARTRCDGIRTSDGFDVPRELSALYAALGDADKEEALCARFAPLRLKTPFDHELVWVETGLARVAAAKGRSREARRRYREAIDVLDRGGYWAEEADALDALAALDASGGRTAAADGSRDLAKSLRTRR